MVTRNRECQCWLPRDLTRPVLRPNIACNYPGTNEPHRRQKGAFHFVSVMEANQVVIMSLSMRIQLTEL